MRPALTPLGTRSLESVLLVSPLLRGPARHRVSPHHVVNHSSQPGATIHRSSDAPVLNFLVGSSSELWKWHRKLGHLSFNLLSRLIKLNLVRQFPRLRFEKELVCALCRHAKMVASSHPPLTDVMTERPCELLHMDLVGPDRVRSVGGKWYVLVVVDDC
jgi:hypothetical protein